MYGYAEENYLSKRELSNRKVLVVEDEMMIAMLIEDMLDAFGCKLVGPATSVPRALELIGKEKGGCSGPRPELGW